MFNGKIHYFDWAIFNSELLVYQREWDIWLGDSTSQIVKSYQIVGIILISYYSWDKFDETNIVGILIGLV